MYLYQLHLFQTYVAAPGSLAARLLGLSQFVYTNCEQPAHFYFNWENTTWTEYCSPGFILALYWLIAVEFSYYGAAIKTALSTLPSPPQEGSANPTATNTDTDTDNDANEKQVNIILY